MEKIKISVVIPSYKTEVEIMERTINSVLSQSYKPYEVIVIDDNGGNQYTSINKKLSSKYHDSVRFIFYENNKGANYARNLGIQNATGDYIAFLDADDEWFINYLEKNVSVIKNNNAKFISNGYYVVTQYGKFNYDRSLLIDGDVSRKILIKDLGGPTSAIVVERNTLLKAGLFDTSLPARQDYDMWIRCAQIVDFYYNNNPIMNIYRDGHDSISSSYKRNIQGTLMVLNKILDTYNLSKEEIRNVKYAHYSRMAMSGSQGNNFECSRKYMKMALNIKFSFLGLLLYIGYCLPFAFIFMRNIRDAIRTKSN